MKRQKVKFRWLSTLATCLVLALCIGISIPLAGCNNTEAEAGTVTMEINPGVEYVIARNGNVKAVRFLNDDAEKLLEEIELKGQSLKSALSITVAAYKAAYNGETPDQFAADGYDAIYTIAEAIKNAGLSSEDKDDFSARIVAAMTKITVKGVTGTMTWSADGETSKDAKAMVIKDGVAVAFSK